MYALDLLTCQLAKCKPSEVQLIGNGNLEGTRMLDLCASYFSALATRRKGPTTVAWAWTVTASAGL